MATHHKLQGHCRVLKQNPFEDFGTLSPAQDRMDCYVASSGSIRVREAFSSYGEDEVQSILVK